MCLMKVTKKRKPFCPKILADLEGGRRRSEPDRRTEEDWPTSRLETSNASSEN